MYMNILFLGESGFNYFLLRTVNAFRQKFFIDTLLAPSFNSTLKTAYILLNSVHNQFIKYTVLTLYC